MEPANGRSSALEQLAAEKLAAAQAALPGGMLLAPPTKLDELDRLRVECRYLKMQLIVSRIKEIDAEKKDLGLQLVQYQAEMKKDGEELTLKYGTPIGPGSVTPDGTIKPAAKSA